VIPGPLDAPRPFPDETPTLLEEGEVRGLTVGRDAGVGLMLQTPAATDPCPNPECKPVVDDDATAELLSVEEIQSGVDGKPPETALRMKEAVQRIRPDDEGETREVGD
jgi:hypothetical protein